MSLLYIIVKMCPCALIHDLLPDTNGQDSGIFNIKSRCITWEGDTSAFFVLKGGLNRRRSEGGYRQFFSRISGNHSFDDIFYGSDFFNQGADLTGTCREKIKISVGPGLIGVI